MRQRQFRRLFRRTRGDGEPLRSLELRLDNVRFRLGFASTRAQARQFVVHGHVQVNGRKADVPSFRMRPGDRVSLRTGSPVGPLVREATDFVSVVPRWLARRRRRAVGFASSASRRARRSTRRSTRS